MRTFDWLDLVIIAVVVLAAVRGYRRGASSQLFSYGGFGLGLVIGLAIASFAVGLVTTPLSKALVALVVVLAVAAVVGGIGSRFGSGASRMIRRVHLGPFDSVAGAAVAGIIALAVCLLAANLLVRGPSPTLSAAISRSAVIARLDRNLPAATNQIGHLGRRIRGSRLVTDLTDTTPPGTRGNGPGLGSQPVPAER